MSAQKIHKYWFGMIFIISIYMGYYASCENPIPFIKTSGLLLNVFAILIGLLLAIYSLLIVPHDDKLSTLENKELKNDNENLLFRLNILFWCYYISLISAIVLSIFFTDIEKQIDIKEWHRWAVGTYVIITCFTLLWSATLPSLLKNIKQRDFNLYKN